jgi:predicted patatin/cPLA2 family phospholipase
MKALVLSGEGTKETFTDGVAEHLIRLQNKKYDFFLHH